MAIKLTRKQHEIDVLGLDGDSWVCEINIDDLPFTFGVKIPYDPTLSDSQIQTVLTANYDRYLKHANRFLADNVDMAQLWKDVQTLKQQVAGK